MKELKKKSYGSSRNQYHPPTTKQHHHHHQSDRKQWLWCHHSPFLLRLRSIIPNIKDRNLIYSLILLILVFGCTSTILPIVLHFEYYYLDGTIIQDNDSHNHTLSILHHPKHLQPQQQQKQKQPKQMQKQPSTKLHPPSKRRWTRQQRKEYEVQLQVQLSQWLRSEERLKKKKILYR